MLSLMESLPMCVYLIHDLQTCLNLIHFQKTFWDPHTQQTFHYNRISSAWIPEWWLGEPVSRHDLLTFLKSKVF